MLSERTLQLGLGDKGLFTYPFVIPKKKGNETLHNKSESFQPVPYMSKIQADHPKQREAIHLGHLEASLDIKSAYCHIPITRRHHCFLNFKGKNTYQFRTLPFGL